MKNNHLTLQFLVITLLFSYAQAACSYTQSQDPKGFPYAYDGEAFAMNYTMEACKQYIGMDVCCNQANAKLTYNNLKQLDGAFSSESGGCDICAINLKRMWCEYGCSPRQSEFLKVSKQYYQYPDPQNPGGTLLAQEANLTVQASTACAIYSACRRVPFVASVSALNTPAGFLNFQGHNAINDAKQYISIVFTYDPSKGLYLNDATNSTATKAPTSCNYNEKLQLHGFGITSFCSCNSCEEACDASQGYHYEEPSILEGFNYILVGSILSGVALVTGGLTCYRNNKRKKIEKGQ